MSHDEVRAKPVVFLAFANEQEGVRYLRNLPEEYRQLQERSCRRGGPWTGSLCSSWWYGPMSPSPTLSPRSSSGTASAWPSSTSPDTPALDRLLLEVR